MQRKVFRRREKRYFRQLGDVNRQRDFIAKHVDMPKKAINREKY